MLRLIWPILVAFAAPAAADTLVVGNKVDDTLSFIDLMSGEEVARPASGRWPHELTLSPDGETVVVVSYRDETEVGRSLDLFDVRTAERTGVIDLSPAEAPHGILWVPGTESIVVVTQKPVNVLRVDIARREVIDALVTGEDDPHLIALSPDGSRLYITNRGSNTVSVASVDPLEVVATWPADDGAEAIALTPDGAELWVGNRTAETITVFDTRDGTVLRDLAVGFDPVRLAVSPDGALIAVADYSNARVVILDATTGAQLAVVDLEAGAGISQPSHLGFSDDGAALFVSGQKAGVVAEYQSADWSLSRVLPAAAGADGQVISPIVTKPRT